MATVTTSSKFSLDGNDFLKGLLVAVGTAVLTTVITSLNAGNFSFNWKAVLIAAVSAAGTYLGKNFLAPAEVKVTDVSKQTVEAVKQGDAEVVIKPV